VSNFKGFDANMKCRDFQFAVGEEYTHDGDVKACETGFHACEYPLDVFNYYPPAGSVFAEVEQSGTLSKNSEDSKVASSVLKVKASISIAGLVKAAIDYTLSRAKPEGKSATGNQGAASATGDRGAASATGYQGAASATGNQGRAKGAKGNALFLVERDARYNIIAVGAAIVGKKGIKPDTWYVLTKGKFTKVESY
jgi:hypothetical protein